MNAVTENFNIFEFEDNGFWIDNTYMEAWNEVNDRVAHTCQSVEDAMVYSLEVAGVIPPTREGTIPQEYFEMDEVELHELCQTHNVKVVLNLSVEQGLGDGYVS